MSKQGRTQLQWALVLPCLYECVYYIKEILVQDHFFSKICFLITAYFRTGLCLSTSDDECLAFEAWTEREASVAGWISLLIEWIPTEDSTALSVRFPANLIDDRAIHADKAVSVSSHSFAQMRTCVGCSIAHCWRGFLSFYLSKLFTQLSQLTHTLPLPSLSLFLRYIWVSKHCALFALYSLSFSLCLLACLPACLRACTHSLCLSVSRSALPCEQTSTPLVSWAKCSLYIIPICQWHCALALCRAHSYIIHLFSYIT